MTKQEPLASVVILTFNGAVYLREVLEAVLGQKASFPYEVLVIDSGSRDGSLEIIRSYPVKLHEIPNSEFNHGETRNLGARLARGQFVAYLTQDATPADKRWLQHLVDAFELGPKVAAVYGLHVPRPNCDPVTRRDMEEFFKMMGPQEEPTIRYIKEGEEGRQEYQANEGVIAFYSDVNSCLRKSVWNEIPYRPLDYAEDQALGRDVLEAGYWKVYEPRAAVIHSHRFPLLGYFRRQFDEYRGLRRSIGFTQSGSLARVFLGALKGGSVDSRYIWREKYSLAAKLKWTPYAYSMNLLRRMAGYLAAREHRLPRRLVGKLSHEAQAKRKARGEAAGPPLKVRAGDR